MNGRQETNEAIERFLSEKLINKPKVLHDYRYSFAGKTAMTKRNYIVTVINYLDYLSANNFNITDPSNFSSIKPSDINRYMEEKIHYRYVEGKRVENKEDSRAVKLFAISNFFNFLMAEGYIDHNPCDKVSVPHSSVEKEIVALDSDEITKMMNNIKTGVGSKKSIAEDRKYINRNLAIVALGFSVGLRVTSICEINISDIDFSANKITVREKGNKERDVFFGNNTKEIIIKWISDRNKLFPNIATDALFISKKKQRLAPRSVADMIKKYSVGINKHITPHKMRSTCATNLYEKTGDIYLVQSVLGHKNIENTRRYAKMSGNKRMEAAKIMDDLI